MAFLEISDFCDVNEFTRHKPNRVLDGNLEVDGIYTVMMRLADDKKQAAKQAVKLEDISHKAGLVVIRFAFLDEDLVPHWETTEKISDGIIEGFEKTFVEDHETGHDYPIVEAYLRDYFNGQFHDMLDTEQLLTVSK